MRYCFFLIGLNLSLKIQEAPAPTFGIDQAGADRSSMNGAWKRHFVELTKNDVGKGRRRRRRGDDRPKITAISLSADQTAYDQSITMTATYTFDKSVVFGGLPAALLNTHAVPSCGSILLPYTGITTQYTQTFSETFRANSFVYSSLRPLTSDSFSQGGNSILLRSGTTDGDLTHLSTLDTSVISITHGVCLNQQTGISSSYGTALDGSIEVNAEPCTCGNHVCLAGSLCYTDTSLQGTQALACVRACVGTTAGTAAAPCFCQNAAPYYSTFVCDGGACTPGSGTSSGCAAR